VIQKKDAELKNYRQQNKYNNSLHFIAVSLTEMHVFYSASDLSLLLTIAFQMLLSRKNPFRS